MCRSTNCRPEIRESTAAVSGFSPWTLQSEAGKATAAPPPTASMNGSRPRGPNSEWEDKAMRKCSVLLAALTLSACGSRTPLTPPEGQRLPPQPLAPTETPTPQHLMEPRSEEQPSDLQSPIRHAYPVFS